MNLIQLVFLIKHMYLRGMWVGVAPWPDIKKTRVSKTSEVRAQNTITSLGSIAKPI